MIHSRRKTIARIIYLLNSPTFLFMSQGFAFRGKRLRVRYVNRKASHTELNKLDTTTLRLLHDCMIIAESIAPNLKRNLISNVSKRGCEWNVPFTPRNRFSK